MMYCYQCRCKISPNDKFCPQCGAPVVDPNAVKAADASRRPVPGSNVPPNTQNASARANAMPGNHVPPNAPNTSGRANAMPGNHVPPNAPNTSGRANAMPGNHAAPNAQNTSARANAMPGSNVPPNAQNASGRANAMPGNHAAPNAQNASGRANAMPGNHAAANAPNTSSVKYVYVDQRTGKITENPHVKSGSESFMQWMTVVFIALGLVIAMVAGSMYISGQMVKSVFSDNVVSELPDAFLSSDDTASEEPVSSAVSSDVDVNGEQEADTESEVSSQPAAEVSSESVPVIAPTQKADYLQSKLKGTWSTSIPYKSMSLPATFVFDGNGKCSCVLQALFISKKFEGTYTVRDGGKCSITLLGLEDYVSDGNTMTGDLEFVSDNQLNFTTSNAVWVLNRKE